MNVMFRGVGREIGTTLVAAGAPGLGGMRCWLDTHSQGQRERATKRNERDMGAGESTCSASRRTTGQGGQQPQQQWLKGL